MRSLHQSHTGLFRRLAAVVISLLFMSTVNAAEAEISDAEMERIKQEVMQELRESDFLQREIEAGILAYIEKQRQQQAAAQAAQERQLAERAKNVRRVDPDRDHIYGDPAALVSIIEYSDTQCPYCQAFHKTPKQVVGLYQGRVNWVYRHFPLSFHNPAAQIEAEASECVAELAGNDSFWVFIDALYARGPLQDKNAAQADIQALVAENGIDQNAFANCFSSSKYRARVTDDMNEGSSIGINGTPGTVILNNENGAVRLVSGAVPPDSLISLIEEVLN